MGSSQQRKLEIVLAGDPAGANRAMDSVERRAGSLGSGMKRAFGVAAVGATAAVAAVGLVGKALYDVGDAFDGAYDTIRIQTGRTGAALDGLKDTFRGVVSDVPTSFDDAGTAVAGLTQRLGLTGPALERVAEPLLNLTRMTGGDTQANVANMSRLFGDWGISAERMPAVLDEVFRASQQTGAGVDTLATSAVQFGAPLRQMGFSLEQTLALFGKFEAEGVNTSTVLSGMRRGLATFARDGEAPAEALSRIVDQIKAAGSTAEANQLALEVFGTRAGPDMAAAIREGRFELDDLVAGISGGSDTINQAAADTADFSEKWTIFKNRVLLRLEPIATAVFDGVGRAMTRLGPIAQEVGDWLEENIPPAFEAVRAFAERTWPQVRDAFLDAVSAISSWWDENGPAIMGAFEDLKAMWSSVFDYLRLVVERWAGVLSNLWNRFGRQWLGHVQVAFSAIVDVFRGTFEFIHGIFETFIGIFTGDWGRAWDGVKSIFAGLWDAIGGLARLGLNALSGIIGAGMAVISAAWGYVWRGIQNALGVVWNGIVGLVRGEVNRARSIISDAWNAVLFVTSIVWTSIKSAVTGALDGIKGGIRTARDVIADVWGRIKSLFRAPVSAVLRVVVNPFLGFLDRVAGVVGLSVPHDFTLPEFHRGGVIPGRGPKPIMALGGEGVVNPEAMRELGPRGLARINRGEIGDGIGDTIGGILGPTPLGQGAIDAARGLTQEVLDAATSGMRNLIGRIDELVPADFLRSAFRATHYPLDAILRFVDRVGPSKVLASQQFGPGPIWEKLWNVVRTQFPWETLTSSFRPGAITATGNRSLHALGRAIDIGPSMEVFDWLASNYPRSGELIYSPAGNRQIYKGSPHFYGEPTRGDHWNHIHWGMFDRGGWLYPGLTMAYNGTGRPERVHGPGELAPVHYHLLEGATVYGASGPELERLILGILAKAKRKGLVAA